jgi:hypothetical protein
MTESRCLGLSLLLALLLGGCATGGGALFAPSPVHHHNACDHDFAQRQDLERLSFTLPPFWARLQPCEAVQLWWDTRQDSLTLDARSETVEGGVLVLGRAAGLGISANLDDIGHPQRTPEEWLAWKQSSFAPWGGPQGKSGNRIEREVTRIELREGELDCWFSRVDSYGPKPGTRGQQETQVYLGMSYHCWVAGQPQYPPIGVGGGMAYFDERPLYDIDIDRDLLLPVLQSLEIRELSPDAYAARKQAYLERQGERCKRIARRVRLDGDMNDYQREQLLECGYDLDTLKRIEPR